MLSSLCFFLLFNTEGPICVCKVLFSLKASAAYLLVCISATGPRDMFPAGCSPVLAGAPLLIAMSASKSLLLHRVMTWCCICINLGFAPCQGRSPKKFNKGECKVLYLRKENTRQQHMQGAARLESSQGNVTMLLPSSTGFFPFFPIHPGCWRFFFSAWKGPCCGRWVLSIP